VDRLENLLGTVSLAVSDRLRGAGSGDTEAAALVTLLAHPGQTTGWLGGVLGLTTSGATRLAERLVAAGWVRRDVGGDGRQRRLVLTPVGAGRAGALLDGRRSALTEVLGALADADRAVLEGLLERMVSGLAEGRGEALRVCRMCDRAACCGSGGGCPLAHAVDV
jgi:DNA-binding MarR family transcriptional regulator